MHCLFTPPNSGRPANVERADRNTNWKTRIKFGEKTATLRTFWRSFCLIPVWKTKAMTTNFVINVYIALFLYRRRSFKWCIKDPPDAQPAFCLHIIITSIIIIPLNNIRNVFGDCIRVVFPSNGATPDGASRRNLHRRTSLSFLCKIQTRAFLFGLQSIKLI